MSRLTFDAETHTYRLGKKVLPSVTQIIRAAGLMDQSGWSEYARSRGSAVHQALNYLDENDLDWSTVEGSIDQHILAYNQFRRDSGATVVVAEQPVCSRLYGYAGTLDRILNLHGRNVLVDIKTGEPPTWSGVQLAGYQQAAQELGYRIFGNFVLWLRADGTYRLIPRRETPNDFLYILQKVRANEQRERHAGHAGAGVNGGGTVGPGQEHADPNGGAEPAGGGVPGAGEGRAEAD